MSKREQLLELERRKLALLRNKVVEQERLVMLLETLSSDAIDAVLEDELAGEAKATSAAATAQPVVQTPALPTPAPEPEAETAVVHAHAQAAPSPLPTGGKADVFVWQRRPRRVPDTWVKLLTWMGEDGKTYEQVKEFIDANSLPLSHGAARTQLMNYRRDFDFVENPRKGFYTATKKALDFIRTQTENEGRLEAPAVGADGASGVQQLPLDRAAA